ncbi:MAG: DUF2309 family protein [Acidobacteria bacterium]|nr:DUF2309 family protein [Acidobacteriota bacterium]
MSATTADSTAHGGVEPVPSLRDAIDHAAHLLPSQGPLNAFVHHNTLHALEEMPFEDAVVEAYHTRGAQPYMSEAAYRRAIEAHRIRVEDIEAVLAKEPNPSILGDNQLDRGSLRSAILRHRVGDFSVANIGWHLEEGDVRRRLNRDLDDFTKRRLINDAVARAGESKDPEAAAAQEIFAAARLRVASAEPARPVDPVRPRDGILAAFGLDLDEVVHPVLIHLCATFLDQGQAFWPMPGRDQGLLRAARRLLALPGAIYPEALTGLGEEMRRQEREGLTALEVIERVFGIFGIQPEEMESVIGAELLALPGWPGMIRHLEQKPAAAPHERVPFSLDDYLALRLTLMKVGAASVAAKHDVAPVSRIWRVAVSRPNSAEAARQAAAARLAETAQVCGLTASELANLDERSMARLLRELEEFDHLERRRILHLAYERRHERRILSPLAQHRRSIAPAPPPKPVAQVFFCIDDREESIRRHLEEVDPEIETLAVAGFFGVAIDYQGLDDVQGSPLCPVVVTPQHAIHEQPSAAHQKEHRVRQSRRKLWAQLAYGSFLSSRTLVRGWFSAAFLGLLSVFPLAARILAPRPYGKLRRWLNSQFLPAPRTELTMMRDDARGRAIAEGLQVGFTTQEKVDCVESVLGPVGLHERFARLVILLGHGSTSLNNPLEAAYNCGACGGRRGGPNARLFAALANRPNVREGLAARGIKIPADTWFIGGYHDTCSGDIELADLDRVPVSHRPDLERVTRSFREAQAWEAHERVRRFDAAPKGSDPYRSLRHVEERSEHLAEPLPEYGHCTNAVTIVGRRAITRGLFLDRRAFLVSYDAAFDPDDENLAKILSAAVPVCAGIALEYYFSAVDNERYGCGTKLPHNVVGLLGVMNGASSDLRTGLARQMIEIHEPLRGLYVIETTPERFLNAAKRNAEVLRLLENRWVRLATMDRDTGEMQVYRDGVFEPYTHSEDEPLGQAPTSADWFQGKSDHLGLAQITRTVQPMQVGELVGAAG